MPFSRASTETIYPVSPVGDAVKTVPAPFAAGLQDRLNVIGKQDLNAHS